MSAPVPLLHGFDDDATVAWRRGRPVGHAAFRHDVAALADRLPDATHVLNASSDRYRFAVGLAAAIVRGQISLLPPSTHAATIAQLRARFPDAYALVDEPRADIDLAQHQVDADGTAGRSPDVPDVPPDRIVAFVFTSGSTGVPTLHRKRWDSLVVNVRSAAERLGCGAGSPPHAIVATVPPQHMYGLESSLLLAWQGGNALVAERPFYPADVAAALARLPGPRMLVTTPFHLRTLVDADADLPPLARIVSATAPLPPALAASAERRFAAPVLEIYGCTETGQLASRRPVDDPLWRLLGDVTIDVADGRAVARGGHVDEPTTLGDAIELAPDFATSRRFALGGRSQDLVNVAGKRTSLGHLNAQLAAIDGVVDGVFVAPDDDDRGGVARLAAIVVAPTLDAARLTSALRERIDAVFLPRPIHFVDRIPRNDTGKLTRALLDELVASLAARGGSSRPGGEAAAP